MGLLLFFKGSWLNRLNPKNIKMLPFTGSCIEISVFLKFAEIVHNMKAIIIPVKQSWRKKKQKITTTNYFETMKLKGFFPNT